MHVHQMPNQCAEVVPQHILHQYSDSMQKNLMNIIF